MTLDSHVLEEAYFCILVELNQNIDIAVYCRLAVDVRAKNSYRFEGINVSITLDTLQELSFKCSNLQSLNSLFC